MEKLFKHLKVYTLDNDVVRFEYSPNDEFTTKESLFVAHKKVSYEEVEVKEGNLVSFVFKGFEFSFDQEQPLATLLVTKDDKVVYKYHDIQNSGVLPLPNKTPEIFPLLDSPRLLLPSDGYTKDNEGFVLQKDVKDLFLLLCEKDHLKLRRQFLSLTGTNTLPRIKNFGLFASRNYKHTQKSAIDNIHKYEVNNIPLDTFVMDAKELKDENYDVNDKYYSNVEDFFRFAHKKGIQILMDEHVHPLNEDSKIFDNDEIEYRNAGLTKLFSKGLDGWWLDKISLKAPSSGIPVKSSVNYAYFDISKQFHLGFTLDPEVYERALMMNKVSGQLDSRSHIYPLQCGEHNKADEQSLRNEIINMNKAASNMVAHYSADIGGFSGEPTKNQFIRWMQFGAFSPVLRPHSDSLGKKGREPWSYDKSTLEICKNYIYMRYALLDVFYTASFKNMESGLGVCSPLYLYNPDDKKCYKEDTSFMLGNSILVAPISGAEKPHSLKKQHFVHGLRLTIYPNKEFKGPKFYTKVVKSFEDINKLYRSVKEKHPEIKKFSFRYKGDIKFKSEYQLSLKNAVKSRVFLNNKIVFDNFNSHTSSLNELARIKRNRTYKLVVETIQRRRPQELDVVFFKVSKPIAKTKVYLPEGEWFNIFHRNVYQGKRFVKEKYKIDETPVFVKAGALLPLYKKITNTSKLSFKTVIYDYYTSKKEKVNDFFYEDDGVSTGYRIGEYRKNEYRTYFEGNRYIVEFKGNPKMLDDDLKIREVFFKAHIRDNETIDKVLINDEPVKFKRHDHAKKAIPFLDPKFARDSKTLTFKFRHIIKEDYKIELFVKEK